ncbi:MAG: hypothetical protein AAF892_13285, partial [Cyanobacteria bacterium P01_D01_bin.71]
FCNYPHIHKPSRVLRLLRSPMLPLPPVTTTEMTNWVSTLDRSVLTYRHLQVTKCPPESQSTAYLNPFFHY